MASSSAFVHTSARVFISCSRLRSFCRYGVVVLNPTGSCVHGDSWQSVEFANSYSKFHCWKFSNAFCVRHDRAPWDIEFFFQE